MPDEQKSIVRYLTVGQQGVTLGEDCDFLEALD